MEMDQNSSEENETPIVTAKEAMETPGSQKSANFQKANKKWYGVVKYI